jgi:hypothetical protein
MDIGFGQSLAALTLTDTSFSDNDAVENGGGVHITAYRSDKSPNANSPDLGGSSLVRDWAEIGARLSLPPAWVGFQGLC